MHSPRLLVLILLLSGSCVHKHWAAEAAVAPGAASLPGEAAVSFRNEVQQAIDRGLGYLKQAQHTNGWWSTPDAPALTALALMTFKGDPLERYRRDADWMRRGYAKILECRQEDGGIHKGQLVTYNTALCMMALLAARAPEYDPVILKARQFLIGLQTDWGEKGKADDPFDGGIGYGSRYEHSDMGNTLQALEALYYSKHLQKDKNLAGARDLNWQAAIHFLQNCQNLAGYNSQAWVSEDAKDTGGFVYYPGYSMAGGVTNAGTGRVSLRSYGSITYAGLLSYIYAELRADDPRVRAVYDWLTRNYTLEENPGMGAQGLFYYYHIQAKALAAYGVNLLALKDGLPVNWRRELGMRLINLQGKDGAWINEQHGRWWEKDPVLVTAYAVLTLEIVYRGL